MGSYGHSAIDFVCNKAKNVDIKIMSYIIVKTKGFGEKEKNKAESGF